MADIIGLNLFDDCYYSEYEKIVIWEGTSSWIGIDCCSMVVILMLPRVLLNTFMIFAHDGCHFYASKSLLELY